VTDPQRFHEQQKTVMDGELFNPSRKAIHESWFKEDTVDYWRHKRMYEAIEPIAKFYKDAQWVSIGDGRYGLDSYRLKKLFGINVLPTDIANNMLERGKDLGLFDRYSVENAESLSFNDNSFDIIFCKEALHHMPRPLVAIYEMLRVCRKALILIEPNDPLVFSSPKKLAKTLLSSILERRLFSRSKHSSSFFFSPPPPAFEPSGNYIYSLSKREMIKVVQGLNMPGLAWKGINDYYIQGCEFEVASPTNLVYKKVLSEIKRQDRNCRQLPQFFDYGLIVMVLFKEEIIPTLKNMMLESEFEFPVIEKNPYS